jgi:hypothetical protein
MLRLPYSSEPIPLELASAGVRRIVALAYALVWAWVSHRKELRTRKGMVTEAHQIVFLFDEIEAHLHPQWQRLILPAMLRALKILGGGGLPVQIIGTTHAPLVLASMEIEFESATDRLFNFEHRELGRVVVEEVRWAKFGDASGWLTSPAFDMDSGYSKEAEVAMKAADDLMAGYLDELPRHLRKAEQIHAELRRTLDGGDPYWPLWLPYYRKQRSAA